MLDNAVNEGHLFHFCRELGHLPQFSDGINFLSEQRGLGVEPSKDASGERLRLQVVPELKER